MLLYTILLSGALRRQQQNGITVVHVIMTRENSPEALNLFQHHGSVRLHGTVGI